MIALPFSPPVRVEVFQANNSRYAIVDAAGRALLRTTSNREHDLLTARFFSEAANAAARASLEHRASPHQEDYLQESAE
jgi:hypothetical protein